MKPRQNALRSNLIRFFTDNPDEELTMDDICSKFGCTEMQCQGHATEDQFRAEDQVAQDSCCKSGSGGQVTVAVLFARADSHYKALPGVDVWDEARDARRWPGGTPLVAHPPCRLWAKLRQFAKARDPVMERQLAIDAVRRVQRFGGVLEHPAEGTLWAHMGLPAPGRAPDDFGGWTAEIRQCDWGHKAEKLTWLYIVGCHPDDLPELPQRGEPTGVIKPQRGVPRTLKIVTKAEREHTPPQLAVWLVALARRCRTNVSC